MPEQIEIGSDKWWRFNRYEIVGQRFIRPARGAELEEYDPWERYRAARERGKEQPAPYESLLKLANRLKFSLVGQPVEGQGRYRSYVLTPESEEVLLEWCAQHGLLGILPQQVRMAALAPRWRGLKSTLRPVQTVYSRTNTGWLARHASPGYRESDGGAAQNDPRKRGQLVAESGLENDWSHPHVILQRAKEPSGLEPGLTVEPLSRTWARFFPSVSKDERETFEYPPPLSEKFWRLYGEPLDQFLDSVMGLQSGMAQFKASEQSEESPDSSRVEDVELAWDPINAFIGSSNPVLEREGDGRARQRWNSPSLLGMFGMMTMLDLEGGRRILRCAVCGTLVSSKAWQATYCSDTCRNTAQKRTHRSRKKAEQLSAAGLSIRQIAKKLKLDTKSVRKLLNQD